MFPTLTQLCIHRLKKFKLKKTNTFLNQRLALIVNSHTHYRMWYLTDQSTPAGLSLCLGCGLLATGPSSYRNGMGRGGSAQSQGGAGTASILLLPYHLHHRAAAVCLSTQRHCNNVCSISHISLQRNETGSPWHKSTDTNHGIINLYLQQ